MELVEIRASREEVSASWTVGVGKGRPTRQVERGLTIRASLDARGGDFDDLFCAIHGNERGAELCEHSAFLKPRAI